MIERRVAGKCESALHHRGETVVPRTKLFWIACLAGATLGAPPARADVKPHALISDGMVLQQGRKVALWGTAADGEAVRVKLQGKEASTQAKGGRWLVHLDGLEAGGPFEMTIRGQNEITFKSVFVGEVWLASGQSNMEWPVRASADAEKVIASSKNPKIRLFTVPKTVATAPRRGVQGTWQECGPDTVASFSAVAYFFGRDLQKARNVPVGVIHTSWGGTPAEAWTSRQALTAEPALKGMVDALERVKAEFPETIDKYVAALQSYKDAVGKARAEGKEIPDLPQAPAIPGKNPWAPSGLYNAMIAPLVPYTARGAIWYQGESNAGRAYQYRTLFPAMIRDWRRAWNEEDFPFLFVQLAPFMEIKPEPQESPWAELREAQLLTLKAVPKTGMAVITDVGDERDIHPRWKEPVGARLALAARGIAYGEKVVYSGPVYKGMKVDDGRVVLSFDHVGAGLVARGGPLVGFTVAGEDRKFVKAQAEIHEGQVVVWNPDVPRPVAVRFGWANYPVVNLWNKEGLPASPFRTDDFPMVTNPQK
jgi:sialate O-acetylesterase